MAVSIVFIFENHVFTIVRQNFLRAFPGYTAFPGGKVDKEDNRNTLDETLLVTLKREAQEELGIDIDQQVKNGKIKSIQQIANATSPPFNPLVFETYFYRVECLEKFKFNVDENEAAEFGWCDTASVLQGYNFGKRLIIPPIKVLLEKIGQDPLFLEHIDFDHTRNNDLPSIEPMRNFIQIMPLSNTLPPATRTNAFVLGDEIKILVDPSPMNINEYRKLLEGLKQYHLDKIFITHHHADHHQYAPELARHFNLPIYISQDSFNRCRDKHGENYFKDIVVVHPLEGEHVGTWLGQEINVIAIPGHDEGHLALAPKSLLWCIVGDLFQGVGTVVVGGDEGDMQKYMNSLKKIILMNPKTVTPSHGITLGGTNILQKTLKHREIREEQILELTQVGKSPNEILKTIYFDIPRKLHPYALANIESHLKKLKLENKL